LCGRDETIVEAGRVNEEIKAHAIGVRQDFRERPRSA
jgi:hypothetical protein